MRQTLDDEMVNRILAVFERQAEWVAQHLQREGKALPGERFFTVRRDRLAQPNYLMFVWEKTVYDTTKDDAQIPTSSEMWVKATFGAALLAALTGCKVYVTERPYLPISDVASIKPTVALDSPHNILRSVLTGAFHRGEMNCPRVSHSPDASAARASASLLEVLDILAALWQINSELKAPTERTTKDKHIAERLEVLGTNPLAGAFFYRQYARLNDDATPYPTYIRACSILLKRRGGEMMNIAKQLAQKSLALFLPRSRYGRGKAHLYEVVLRDAVDAIRKAPSHDPDEIKTFAAGTLLKALERRQQSERREGIVNPNRGNLNQLVEEFIALLVDEVLEKRANGSVAAFNRLANQLADAVYFEIDRTLSEHWAAWQAQREEAQTQQGS
jgi:CRISPR type I-D-associated protein Csc3/Cas10d